MARAYPSGSRWRSCHGGTHNPHAVRHTEGMSTREDATALPAGSSAPGPTMLRRMPQWVGTSIGIVFVALASLAAPRLETDAYHPAWGIISVVVMLAGLAARWHWPLIASVIVTLGGVGAVAFAGIVPASIVAAMMAVFSVAGSASRLKTVLVSLGMTAALLASRTYVVSPEWKDLGSALQLATFIGLAAAVGHAASSQRKYIEAIHDRAVRAERTKEETALRRVAEERISIARDLHDVVAHQIAVINLHSSVASNALPDRPEVASQSLETIRDASRTVLKEISTLLGVLRSGATDTAPTRTIADVPALIEAFRSGGLDVEVRMLGAASEGEWPADDDAPVAPATSVAAYRVIQEALTNAHKHGAEASALLAVEYLPDRLEVTVTNTVATPAPAPTAATGSPHVGHGLAGMRERVTSLGGEVTAGTGPGPVYRLSVWMPR